MHGHFLLALSLFASAFGNVAAAQTATAQLHGEWIAESGNAAISFASDGEVTLFQKANSGDRMWKVERRGSWSVTREQKLTLGVRRVEVNLRWEMGDSTAKNVLRIDHIRKNLMQPQDGMTWRKCDVSLADHYRPEPIIEISPYGIFSPLNR